MGAFTDLMLEAKLAGATSIGFRVDLEGFNGETDRLRWTARAVLIEPMLSVPHVAVGRSGEEALRELVTYLKKVGDDGTR